jgi:hypothetical protein
MHTTGVSAPACTVRLLAEVSTIEGDLSVTLSWNSESTIEVDLQPEAGELPTKGPQTGIAQRSTVYALTVTGPGGTNDSTIIRLFLEEDLDVPRRLGAWCMFRLRNRYQWNGQQAEGKLDKRQAGQN